MSDFPIPVRGWIASQHWLIHISYSKNKIFWSYCLYQRYWNGFTKSPNFLDWAQPSSLCHIRLFLRFCNFYQHFIQDFSKLTKSFTGHTKKDAPFDQTWACQLAFESLQKVVTKAPILTYNKSIVETDSSYYISSGVFSLLGKDELLHLVVFFF